MRTKQHIPIQTISQKDKARFFASFVKTGDGCWEWVRTRDAKGYGHFHLHGKIVRAHRFSYALSSGIDPIGSLVCHACDNPRCVNPEHLWRGSHKENTHDMIAKGRHHFSAAMRSIAPRVCVKCGHDRSDDYSDVNGARRCRNCVKIRDERRARLGLRRKTKS